MEDRHPIDREFRRALLLARESRIFQLAGDVARAGGRAVDASRAVRAARAAVRAFPLLAIVDRLRLVGLLVLCAAVTHAVLLLFVPPSLAPAVPLVLPLLVAALAIACAVASRRMAR